MVGAPFQLKAEAGAQAERTFIMIKPDGVQVSYTQVDNTCTYNYLCFKRGLVGEIVKRFEQKGFKLVAIRLACFYVLLPHNLIIHCLLRMMRPGEAHLREHYADLAARPFFPGLVSQQWNTPKSTKC